jgi:DNA-binding transcriptional ArsR family regulator
MASVIRVLAGAQARFGVREIARLAGLQHSTVRVVLDRLVEHGLARTEQAGRSLLCSLNRDHPATGPLVALVTLRSTVIQFLHAELSSWPIPPVHASVFGSFARHDGDTASDIDLPLVRAESVAADDPRWEQSMSEARGRVRLVTGNPLGIVELSVSELREALAAGEPIVAAWHEDGVQLIGERFDALAGLASRQPRPADQAGDLFKPP